MKFWEAMKCLEEGKKVRRLGWHEGEYLYIDEKHNICDEYGNYAELCYIGNKDNWEIYEEKKEVDTRFKEFYHYLKDENGFTNGQYGEFIYNRNEKDHLLEFYQQLLEMAKYYKLD